MEVPSPSGGVLGEINFEAGSTVEVGATLGSIMGSQSASKSDKIEKIKATSETKADNSDNIIKLDEERDTKLFDDTKEEENLEKKPKKKINQINNL